MLVKINICILFSNFPRSLTLFLLLKNNFFFPKQNKFLILVQFQNTHDNRQYCNLPMGNRLNCKTEKTNLLKYLLSSQGDKNHSAGNKRDGIYQYVFINKQVFTMKCR